jgi:hypothetical protein
MSLVRFDIRPDRTAGPSLTTRQISQLPSKGTKRLGFLAMRRTRLLTFSTRSRLSSSVAASIKGGWKERLCLGAGGRSAAASSRTSFRRSAGGRSGVASTISSARRIEHGTELLKPPTQPSLQRLLCAACVGAWPQTSSAKGLLHVHRRLLPSNSTEPTSIPPTCPVKRRSLTPATLAYAHSAILEPDCRRCKTRLAVRAFIGNIADQHSYRWAP